MGPVEKYRPLKSRFSAEKVWETSKMASISYTQGVRPDKALGETLFVLPLSVCYKESWIWIELSNLTERSPAVFSDLMKESQFPRSFIPIKPRIHDLLSI